VRRARPRFVLLYMTCPAGLRSDELRRDLGTRPIPLTAVATKPPSRGHEEDRAGNESHAEQ